MLSFPPKTCEPSATALPSGLCAAIRESYGSLAARALAADAVALQRAREAATSRKVSTAAEAEAAEAALLLYDVVVERLHAVLGTELRDQKGKHLSFAWRSCWDPAERAVSQHDTLTERAAILFNLGACWSMRGAMLPRADGEAIKMAARHFQLAAGALEAAQELQLDSFLPGEGADSKSTSDVSNAALDAVRLLMLAQAQACFCEKAMGDGLGASTQAKLCLGAKQLYRRAADALAALKVSAKKMHAWGADIAMGRAEQFEAQARWSLAKEAEKESQHGLRQAQLQLAAAAVAQAQSRLAAKATAEAVGEKELGALSSLAAKVGAELAAVKRDNELVYYEKPPDPATLDEPDAKVLVKPLRLEALRAPVLDAPLPRSVRHADEEGAEAPVRDLFVRLGGEFKMIPLSERLHEFDAANLDDGSESGRPADSRAASGGGAASAIGRLLASSKEKDKKLVERVSSAERSAVESVGERLTGLFSRAASSRASGGDSSKDSERGGSSNKASAPSKARTSQASTKAVVDGDEEDEELQRALAASLEDTREVDGVGNFQQPPPRAQQSNPPSSPPPPASRDILSRTVAATRPPPPPPSAPPPPSNAGLPPPPSFEEATAMPSVAMVDGLVAQLTSMGFPRDVCLEALRASNYDVSAAANRLLS